MRGSAASSRLTASRSRLPRRASPSGAEPDEAGHAGDRAGNPLVAHARRTLEEAALRRARGGVPGAVPGPADLRRRARLHAATRAFDCSTCEPIAHIATRTTRPLHYLRKYLHTAAGTSALSAELVAGDALYLREACADAALESSRTPHRHLCLLRMYGFYDLAFWLVEKAARTSMVSASDARVIAAGHRQACAAAGALAALPELPAMSLADCSGRSDTTTTRCSGHGGSGRISERRLSAFARSRPAVRSRRRQTARRSQRPALRRAPSPGRTTLLVRCDVRGRQGRGPQRFGATERASRPIAKLAERLEGARGSSVADHSARRRPSRAATRSVACPSMGPSACFVPGRAAGRRRRSPRR